MRLRVIKQIDVRRRAYHLCGQMTKVDNVKHFQTEGIPRSTIYSIIKHCENGLPTKLKKMVEDQVGIGPQ